MPSSEKKRKKLFLAIHLFKKEISEEIFCKIMKKNKSSVLVPSISVDKQKKQRHFREEKSSKELWPGKIPKTKYSASCKKRSQFYLAKSNHLPKNFIVIKLHSGNDFP